jgi:integrase
MAVQWYAKVKRLSLDPHLFEIEKGFMPKAWSNKRDKRLTRVQEQRLYEAGLHRGDFTYTRQDWEAIIGFALETAMRLQEIVRARWDDLVTDDLKLKVRAPNSKTRTDRIALLSKRAREIVASQRAGCPDKEQRIFYQFPNPKAVTEAFGRLTLRADLEDFHFHDLRHEATSRLCESGKLGQMHIMNMTGHKSMTTFQGYVHLMNHETTPTLD